MNRLTRHIALILLAMASLIAVAQEEPHDTVYFFENWYQVFDNEPAAMLADFDIYAYSYAFEFETYNKVLNERIKRQYIAAIVNDDLWLINSHYLYDNFDVDLRYLNHYVPLFFNDKIAYTISVASVSFKDPIEEGDNLNSIDYYFIDFLNRKVQRVSPSVLSGLLEDYHDLQMRYEGMKDYRKRAIIEDYFFKYIERATQDVMRPYILDLVDYDPLL